MYTKKTLIKIFFDKASCSPERKRKLIRRFASDDFAPLKRNIILALLITCFYFYIFLGNIGHDDGSYVDDSKVNIQEGICPLFVFLA